jgi:hypothetical protein
VTLVLTGNSSPGRLDCSSFLPSRKIRPPQQIYHELTYNLDVRSHHEALRCGSHSYRRTKDLVGFLNEIQAYELCQKMCLFLSTHP